MCNNYTSNNLNFQENEIKYDKYEIVVMNGVKTIIVYASLSEESNEIVCPNCGSVSIYKKSFYYRTIKHTPIFNLRTIVKFKQRRFQCRDCKKTFNEQNNFVQKYCKISNSVKLSILNECRKKQSFSDIGDRLNISTSSVEREFDKYIAVERKTLSNVICIDEFKASTEYGKYSLIIGNPVNGEIIDILPKRTQDYIMYYLNKIKPDERLNVKYYITDLFESYRTIHRMYFPKSIHIADRFHWIKLATNAFNNTRISEMNFLKKQAYLELDYERKTELQDMYSVIKSNYRLLLANRFKKEASFFDIQMNTTVDGRKNPTIQEILEYILNNDETIKEAYDLLQSLYKISIQSTYENFNRDIEEWFKDINKSKNKNFKSVMNTYKAWKIEIRNSFIINPITLTRLTNGFIEGKNNYCKVVKRIGFGIKKFDVLRNRILYENNKELTITTKDK